MKLLYYRRCCRTCGTLSYGGLPATCGYAKCPEPMTLLIRWVRPAMLATTQGGDMVTWPMPEVGEAAGVLPEQDGKCDFRMGG